jgi:hypothetical protein
MSFYPSFPCFMTDMGETGTDLLVSLYNNYEFRDNRHRQLHILFPGVKEILPYFLRFLTDLDKIRYKMSQSRITSLMDRKSRVYVQTTPLSSMSTYTLQPSLHCPRTHHTTLFTVYVHITPMSSVYVHTPHQSSLDAYKHTVFTVYLHTGPLCSHSSTHRTTVFTVHVHTGPLSSQSTYTPDHCIHSLPPHRTTVFTVYVYITTLSSISV